jgi:hypothetical protein
MEDIADNISGVTGIKQPEGEAYLFCQFTSRQIVRTLILADGDLI